MLLSAKRRAYFRIKTAIEMGGVSRYFSKVSGSGVDLTFLTIVQSRALASRDVEADLCLSTCSKNGCTFRIAR